MKKSVFIIVAAVIVSIAVIISCSSEMTNKTASSNVASFNVCVSEDLFEIADIYLDYSKDDDTKSLDEGSSIGQIMTSSSLSFDYSGEDSQVGLKIIAKLKDSYTKKNEYNLWIKLYSVLEQKGVSDSLEKEITYTDLREKDYVNYFYYDLNAENPVLSETKPVDWSYKGTSIIKDIKKYDGKYCNRLEDSRDPGKVSAVFLSRLNSKAEDYSKQTEVFIIDGKKVEGLSDDDYSHIVELASRNGKIVLLDVEKDQFDPFIKKFVEKTSNTDKSTFSDEFKLFYDRISSIGENYPGEGYVDFDGKEKIGIIAICNSNLFITEDDEETEYTSPTIITTPTNYAGSSVNYLISWLKEDYKEESKSAYEMAKATANGMSLDSLETAQIVDTTFSASAYKGWRDRSVPVHIRYYIWSAHSLDSGHDFYIIEQEVQAENDKWYCQVQNKNTWDKSTATPTGETGDDWGSYGPYMASLTMDNQIKNQGDIVVVSDYAPTTQSGSTSVSTGVNFTLGGNIGLSGKGVSGGGITGSVTFNRSETVSVPEVAVEVVQDGANLKFKYLGADISTHHRAFHWRTHDLAQGERVNSMAVKNRWIWDIDNQNTNKTYKFSSRIALTSHCMEYHETSFKWNSSTYRNISASTKNVTLLPPSRFCKNYLLQADTPDDWDYAKKKAFQDFMVDKFEDWYSNKNIYSPRGDDLDKLAVEYFNDAMKKFSENKNVIATAGFYGTFNFYIQRTDGGVTLKTQKLEVV